MTSGRCQILIVDDDTDIRETLAEFLEDRGFTTVTAANGLEALTLLRSAAARPSVIVLDLMMPVMDGYGFLEERKRDPALTSIPVAVITASHGVDQNRLGNGASVIAKPIDVTKLVDVLQRLSSSAPSAP
jgi:CheY-like chemotaxis protein